MILDIRIVIPGMSIARPEPFTFSLGGSETSGLQLAKMLAKKGHRVTVYCNAERGFRWNNVNIVPLAVYLTDTSVRSGDLLIIQRDLSVLTLPHTARRLFLWVHDQPNPYLAEALRPALPAVDRLMCVSRWQADQFHDLVVGLRSEKLLVSRNGIELDLINSAIRSVPRDPYRIIYTARPERGLEVLLLQVFPRILAVEPRATLHLAAYDNPVPELEPLYRHLQEVISRLGDRVVQHGALTKPGLYKLMASGGVYLYPTPPQNGPAFAETSCITAMEAMACGLPWVSTDRGALPETVSDAGVLVPLGDEPDAGAGDIPAKMAAEALRIMRDPEHANRLRAAGKARAAGLRWDAVADQVAAAAVESPAPRAVRSIGASPVVAICTPSRGQLNAAYVQSFMETQRLLTAEGIDSALVLLAGDNLVPRARNLIAATALSTPGVTHLLWIDDDIEFAAEDVLKLLQFDVDFACALYPKKHLSDGSQPKDYAFLPLETGSRVPPSDPATGLLEVGAAGTGFMLTKRAVYEKMMAAYPQDKILVPDDPTDQAQIAVLPFLHNFFPVYVEDGRIIGEDYTFCRRWRALGGKVLVDTEIRLTHHGLYGFKGNPAKMFRSVPEHLVTAAV